MTVVVLLAGCGREQSSEAARPADAPANADPDAFCHTFGRLGPGTTGREAAENFIRVGTPSGVDAGERRGFEMLVTLMRAAPDDASGGDFERSLNGLDESGRADVNAFFEYVEKTCNN